MDWLDYREKLGIGFYDEEKMGYLITNLITYAKVAFYRMKVTPFIDYILDTGSPLRQKELTINNPSIDESRGSAVIHILLEHQGSLEDFLSYYMPLVNRLNKEKRDDSIHFLKTVMKQAHMLYELFEDQDGFFIFPKGIKEFDDALVSQPLDWLSEYPQAQREWIDALKDYSDLTDEKASEVADKFRKALERFFQEFFNSTKALENLKAEYGTYMKTNGVPSEISNNLETVLQSYTNFMNNYAKHHNRTSKNVLEYILYQTGNIMRLLITLKQDKKGEKE